MTQWLYGIDSTGGLAIAKVVSTTSALPWTAANAAPFARSGP